MNYSNADSPAMPQTWVPDFGGKPAITALGLSKREHFAAMALNTILGRYNPYWDGDFDSSEWDETAKNAVGLADALLKALESDNA